ncbi:protein-disulfide isomerase [Streptacidiphilus sp. MAP12-20]|uniref:DsbA family protein n=1 Tax=Streptacidiphilus sp. MAP12-20 TaxID=3156299 RepID=UPI003515C2D4
MTESSAHQSVEFWCDLQSPDCTAALDDVRALRAAHGESVEIALRHFPLEKHKFAFQAAEAAEEAFVQGEGWPFVEALLARTEELASGGTTFLAKLAKELGLDAEELDTALIDGRHSFTVEADHAEGKAIGVKGTPTYVVAGKLLDGSKSQDGLRARVEALLTA